jgi:hypothetical protein
MMIAAFASIIRSENILLVAIGAFALILSAFTKRLSFNVAHLKIIFFYIGISALISLLPTVWWSNHNLKNHGFFGMSNYMGVVLYDGWVYYGDASVGSFSDQDSAAIQQFKKIAKDFPPEITDRKGIATGWETYYSLRAAGYESNQIMDLLKTAALDSIKKDPYKTIELLLFKYQKGLRPGLPNMTTYPLPEEPGWGIKVNNEYFQADVLSLPVFIHTQRYIYKIADFFYTLLYPGWIILALLALVLSSTRPPMLVWLSLISVTASRIFIPLTISVDFWRYTLAGWLPLQIIALAWLVTIITGAVIIFKPQNLFPHRAETRK